MFDRLVQMIGSAIEVLNYMSSLYNLDIVTQGWDIVPFSCRQLSETGYSGVAYL